MKIDANFKIVKGMRDILPNQSPLWLEIEDCLKCHFEKFAYRNIRTPILEKTQLFIRSVGEGTDIVDKEIFHFTDQGGDEICLRPEMTASVVRALIESGEIRSLPIKTWMIAPAFRRERPQKARYRQFHQANIEVFGIESSIIETELILLNQQIFNALGLKKLKLEINTLGDKQDRKAHRESLRMYFKDHFNQLDEDSKKRVDKNPLRILDSKNPAMKPLIENAPKIDAYLSNQAKAHFEEWKKTLTEFSIEYQINPNLVRGIDYYNRSVFEWMSEDDELGSGSTICGGGRYDYLVSEICNQSNEMIPAIGCAIGLDRLVMLIEKLRKDKVNQQLNAKKKIFILNAEVNNQSSALLSLKLLNEITNHRSDLITENVISDKKINKQFDKAIQSNADLIITLFDKKLINEMDENTLLIREVAQSKSSQINAKELINWLNQNYPN